MSNESSIDVRIGATTADLRAGMKQASDTVKSGVEQMKGHFDSFGGVFEKLFKGFAAVGAVLAGGAVFKDAINETKQFTGEAVALSKQLGITASDAAGLNVALGDIGSSTADFSSAATMLTRQVRTNEDALNAMGLRTRDAKGNLLDLRTQMTNAIETLRTYKEGIDRNAAAQVFFGRSGEAALAFLKLTPEIVEEAKQKQQELGLIVGAENVAALKANKAAMNDAGDVMLAVKKVIGDALLPILTTLANWFSSTGPAAVMVIKAAIATLVGTFYVVVGAVRAVYDVMRNWFSGVIELAGNFSEIMYRLLTGDFAGAAKLATDPIKTAWRNTFDDIVGGAKKTYADVMAIFDKPTDAKAPDERGRRYVDPKQKKEKAATADKSRVSQWESELAQQKVAYQQQNNLREMSKAEEQAYWRNILNFQQVTEAERIAIEKRIAMAQLEEMKKAAAERKALLAEQINEAEAHANGLVELEKIKADRDYALGFLTDQQMLALERQFEDEKFAIAMQAQQARVAAMEGDPNHSPAALMREKDQLLAIERQHAQNVMKITNQAVLVETEGIRGLLNSVQLQLGTVWTQLLTRQTTFAKASKQIMAGLAQASAQYATKMLMDKAAAWIKEQSFYQSMLGVKAAADTAAATQTVATKAGEAEGVVSANAVEAASGAAASAASIPYVGWILAAAAFASVLAMVMGSKSSIKSASAGYDVPRGENPMVQIHSEEMVLPAKYANTIRDMSAGGSRDSGGGANSGGGGDTFVIHAVDAKSVRRMIRDNGTAVASAMREQRRNFNRDARG